MWKFHEDGGGGGCCAKRENYIANEDTIGYTGPVATGIGAGLALA